jgi:hypothetical protein
MPTSQDFGGHVGLSGRVVRGRSRVADDGHEHASVRANGALVEVSSSKVRDVGRDCCRDDPHHIIDNDIGASDGSSNDGWLGLFRFVKRVDKVRCKGPVGSGFSRTEKLVWAIRSQREPTTHILLISVQRSKVHDLRGRGEVRENCRWRCDLGFSRIRIGARSERACPAFMITVYERC